MSLNEVLQRTVDALRHAPANLDEALQELIRALETANRPATAECLRRRTTATRDELAWFLVCIPEDVESDLPNTSAKLTAGAVELRAGCLARAKQFFVEAAKEAPTRCPLEGLAMVAELRGDQLRAARLFAAARTRECTATALAWRRWVAESAKRVAVPEEDDLPGDTIIAYASGVPSVVD